MTFAFMFPGQSSRSDDMFARLDCVARQTTRAVLEEASDVLGRDLAAHYQADCVDQFATNRDVQVGVFVANYAYQRALEERGATTALSLGLSLGEYNHLVHIGALTFPDALRLVDQRGQAYDAGPPGAMASVFPLPLEDLEMVVEQARAVGVLEIVSFNSPAQHVIAGEHAAVDSALAILEAEHAVHAALIEPRIAMHSSCFWPVASAFRPALARARWRSPRAGYVPNVLGSTLAQPTRAEFVDLLARHVWQPVLWRTSIDHLVQTHPGVTFVEVGPGAVLYNLLRRSWCANRKFKTDWADDPASPGALTRLAAELAAVSHTARAQRAS